LLLLPFRVLLMLLILLMLLLLPLLLAFAISAGVRALRVEELA
jgi:hypothetical protein